MKTEKNSIDFEEQLINPGKGRKTASNILQIAGIIGFIASIYYYRLHFIQHWISYFFVVLYVAGMILGMKLSKVTSVYSESGRPVSFDEAVERYFDEKEKS